MKKYIKYIVVLALIGGAYGFYMYNKPHKNLAKTKADVTLSAQDLFTAYELNETKANEIYLGKVLEVDGIIKSIEGENSNIINLEVGSMMSRVSCEMEPDAYAKNKNSLSEGDKVTIRGNCAGMTMDVVLQRCVLIKP